MIEETIGRCANKQSPTVGALMVRMGMLRKDGVMLRRAKAVFERLFGPDDAHVKAIEKMIV